MNIEFDYELKCNKKCEEILVFFDIVFSGLAMLLSLAISFYFAFRHLNNYSNPFFQDKIVVILFMAPFYAITSYFGIIFAHASEYFVLVRDIYEAFLLFTFFYLIFSYLAYEPTINDIIDERVYLTLVKQKEVHHLCPMNWCNKPYYFTDKAKGKYFVYRCKKYILQFLVVKPLATLIIIIASFFPSDSLTADWFETIASYAAMTSVSLSLYYLVLFYHALSKPLSPHRPLLKFLTVKTTLFFTFWQTIALSIFKPKIISYFDEEAPEFNEDKIIAIIQNTLVCLEMLILSVAGGIAFSHKDFITNNPEHKGTLLQAIKGNINSFGRDYRLIKPKVFGFKGHAEINERNSGVKRFSSRILRGFSVKMSTNDLEKALVSAYT